MACRREGISPFVLAQPGRPASSGSVTLHDHGFGSRGSVRHVPHAADHAALENGDAIGPRRAVREGSPPDDARLLQRRSFVGGGLWSFDSTGASASRISAATQRQLRPPAAILRSTTH